MIGWMIVACEIGFWIFVMAGLFARYILGKKTLGALLLLCTPLVDLLLVVFTAIDLKNGTVANTFHGIAAIYIGVTIAYGHQMIRWSDERFAHRFAGGPKPEPAAKHGTAHAKRERSGWYRHLVAWAIGNALLLAMITFIGNPSQTEALSGMMRIWGVVLAVDFLSSFSYTFWPRKDRAAS